MNQVSCNSRKALGCVGFSRTRRWLWTSTRCWMKLAFLSMARWLLCPPTIPSKSLRRPLQKRMQNYSGGLRLWETHKTFLVFPKDLQLYHTLRFLTISIYRSSTHILDPLIGNSLAPSATTFLLKLNVRTSLNKPPYYRNQYFYFRQVGKTRSSGNVNGLIRGNVECRCGFTGGRAIWLFHAVFSSVDSPSSFCTIGNSFLISSMRSSSPGFFQVPFVSLCIV